MTLRGCLYAAGRAAGAPPTRCVGCGRILAEAGPQAQIGCVPQSAYLSPEMGDHAEKAELLVSRYLTSQCTGGSSGKDEYGAKQRSCVMSTCGTLTGCHINYSSTMQDDAAACGRELCSELTLGDTSPAVIESGSGGAIIASGAWWEGGVTFSYNYHLFGESLSRCHPNSISGVG